MPARILVAEDVCAHAKVMRCNLAAAGYEVTIAGDGRQAWLASQREQFDMVITDYKMPYLTGIELCRLLRQESLYAHTPIILVTSYCEDLDMDHLIRSRLDLSAILEKPIAAAKLTKKVEECLAASNAALSV